MTVGGPSGLFDAEQTTVQTALICHIRPKLQRLGGATTEKMARRPPGGAEAGPRALSAEVNLEQAAIMLTGRLPAAVAREFLPERTAANTLQLDSLIVVQTNREIKVLNEDFQNQLDIMDVKIDDRVDAEADIRALAEDYAKALRVFHRRLLVEAKGDEQEIARIRDLPNPAVDYPVYKGKFLVVVQVDYFGQKWQFTVGASKNVEVRFAFTVGLADGPQQARPPRQDAPSGMEVKVETGRGADAKLLVPADKYYEHGDGTIHICSSAFSGQRMIWRPDWPKGDFALAKEEDVPRIALRVSGPHQLFVGSSSGSVHIINPVDGAVVMGNWASGQLSQTYGIVGGPDGNVYCVDSGNGRVAVLSPKGTLVRHIGHGQLSNPRCAAFNAAGQLFVANYSGGNVQVFDPTNGNLVRSIGGFSSPWGLAFDSAGLMYVSNYGGNNVSIVDERGSITRRFGDSTNTYNPTGLYFDRSRKELFVSSYSTSTVSVFGTAECTLARSIGNGALSNPMGVTVSSKGTVLVLSQGHNQVKEFTQEGGFVRAFNVPGSSFTLALCPKPTA